MSNEELFLLMKCVLGFFGIFSLVFLIDVFAVLCHVLMQIEGLLMGLRKELYPYQFEPFGIRIRNWFSKFKRKQVVTLNVYDSYVPFICCLLSGLGIGLLLSDYLSEKMFEILIFFAMLISFVLFLIVFIF